MKQSKRLQPICDFNKKREEDAAKQLALISQEVSAQKQRLFDLENYRNEYGRQFTTAGETGLTATKLMEYQRFLANLSNVVEQQKSAISHLEQQFEEKRRQWLTARSHSKALETVKSRYQHQESVADEKKLQKEVDDRAFRVVKN